MSGIAVHLEEVRARIRGACQRCGRAPESVQLVAVTKGFGADAIREAYGAGQRLFGESYVQEFLPKREQLKDLPDLEWHFIGRLQSNKADQVVGSAALVHSVDRKSLAVELDRRASRHGVTADILLQVRLGEEESKSGVDPSGLQVLARQVLELSRLRVRGLMTLPPPVENPDDARAWFRRLRLLLEECAGLPGWPADSRELSMGMSHDFEAAIAEGATMVRVGAAIFGPRPTA
ncbi:MAG: Pyridoxal phosphate homeostasis protein [Myxococcota bacterium]|nr:Pyridoxal phosphate homeostasis protein [Myxococcota bacterium]